VEGFSGLFGYKKSMARPKVPHWNFFGGFWEMGKTSRIEVINGRIDSSIA